MSGVRFIFSVDLMAVRKCRSYGGTERASFYTSVTEGIHSPLKLTKVITGSFCSVAMLAVMDTFGRCLLNDTLLFL